LNQTMRGLVPSAEETDVEMAKVKPRGKGWRQTRD
jgi:hypothetical protein